MKRILSYITACLVVAAPLTGCIEADYPRGEGRLMLNVDFGETGDDGGARAAEGETRAAAPANYTVKIGTSAGYTHIFSQDEVPTELWLASGSGYFIEVVAGTPQAPNWGSGICYYGWRAFSITDGDTTPVTVNVAPRNTFLTVTFDDTVEEWLTDYSLTIYPDPEDETKTLVFDAENAGRATANIVLDSDQTEIDWLFEATNTDSEEAVEKEGTFAGLLPGKAYSVSFKYTYAQKEGSFTLTVDVDETTDDHGHLIIIPKNPLPVDMFEIAPHEVWATHTSVSGEIEADYEGAGVVRFAYRTTGSEEWTYVAGVEGEAGGFSADLAGLTPETEYETCIELDGELIGDPQTFTTEAATPLYNGGFEDWNQSNGVWYANASTLFWDSGNKGTVTAPVVGSPNNNITTFDAPRPGSTGTKSAKLQSNWFGILGMGAFAAGNLYIGEFLEARANLSNPSGRVNFGRPFTGRPTAMSIWYKVSTGTVNYAKNGAPLSVGQQDQYQILIALVENQSKKNGLWREVDTENWDTIIKWDTDPDVVAFGEIHGSVDMADWSEAVIPLVYRSTERIPTHIVVVASASRYGDYFTGSTSSVMWVDDMELVY